jgi:hypothetical protein
MNPFEIRTIGTLRHVGSGKDWNLFDFYQSPGGDTIRLRNVLAISTRDMDHSRGGFALLGIITAFPECPIMLTRHIVPGGHSVFSIECTSPHSAEIARDQPALKSRDLNAPTRVQNNDAAGDGAVMGNITQLEFDRLPIYKFEAF